MPLQVCIDDSCDDGRFLVLAGFVASAEQWSRFSDEWRELLTIRPSWKRFKTKDVMAMLPGDETEERLNHHIRAINRFAQFGVSVALPIPPLISVVDDLGINKGLKNPYYLAWRSIINETVKRLNQMGNAEPVDFIFDSQSESVHVLTAWSRFQEKNGLSDGNFRVNCPIFRSDDDFLPLQAADYLAWTTRNRIKYLGPISRNPPPLMEPSPEVGVTIYHIDADPKWIRRQMHSDHDALRYHGLPTWSVSLAFPFEEPGQWIKVT